MVVNSSLLMSNSNWKVQILPVATKMEKTVFFLKAIGSYCCIFKKLCAKYTSMNKDNFPVVLSEKLDCLCIHRSRFNKTTPAILSSKAFFSKFNVFFSFCKMYDVEEIANKE